METDKEQNLEIIGSTEYVEIAGIKNIPAKIDTGADSSAIWASHIDMKEDGTLEYVLFNENLPYYSGEVIRTNDYRVKLVRSSHGDHQIRYRVKLPIKIGDKTFETTFTLADRSRNNFPVLIGRHTLNGSFLVDVSRSAVKRSSGSKTARLNTELEKDPYGFHQKYIEKGELWS